MTPAIAAGSVVECQSCFEKFVTQYRIDFRKCPECFSPEELAEHKRHLAVIEGNIESALRETELRLEALLTLASTASPSESLFSSIHTAREEFGWLTEAQENPKPKAEEPLPSAAGYPCFVIDFERDLAEYLAKLGN